MNQVTLHWTDQELAERWQAALAARELAEWRREHERVRVTVTMFNEPDPEEEADTFYVQVKATNRLREIMRGYQCQYPRSWWDFEDAPANFCPQYGPQLVVTEMALFEVTGYWGPDDWRDEDGVRRDCIEWALDDFIYQLTGYHALVEWV